MSDLATRLTKLRLDNGQSLQEVANAVGVSKAHIWQIEKGRAENPAMALVTRLADYFGVSVAYLMGEDLDAPDADIELARMFRQAKELDEADRAMLDQMLQGFLKRRRAEN